MTDIRLPGPAAEALARGQLIEAVKIVRQASGLGLKDAHDLVQRYQQQAARGVAGIRTAAQPAGSPQAASGGFVFPQEASTALAQGDLIQAIAALRRANPQLDLASAKHAIDTLRRNDAATPAGFMQRASRIPTVVEGDRGGHVPIVVALVAVVVAIAWWFGSN